MTEYLLFYPAANLTAKVYAPSTEKARTTLLDYLERTGQIERNQRQDIRKNIITGRLEDTVDADITLHYGYQDGGTISSLREISSIEEGNEIEVEEPQYSEEMVEMAEKEFMRPQEPTMPIQRLVLGLD